MLIDSHCHFAKSGDASEWIERMETAGVGAAITVGTSLEDWEPYRKLSERCAGKIFWTAGLHPCSVEEDWRDAVAALPTFFATDPSPVAVGEIGLDYFHLPKYEDERAEIISRQRAAFSAQLDLANQLDCPVVVHSRKAFADCVEIIDRSGLDWSKVVFHCFSEGPAEMAELKKRGGFGSFTGILTYGKSADSLRQAAVLQGLDRFMVETDAPYLTPEPHRGKRNEPAYARIIAEKAAEIFGADYPVIMEKSRSRTIEFFGLKGLV